MVSDHARRDSGPSYLAGHHLAGPRIYAVAIAIINPARCAIVVYTVAGDYCRLSRLALTLMAPWWSLEV